MTNLICKGLPDVDPEAKMGYSSILGFGLGLAMSPMLNTILGKNNKGIIFTNATMLTYALTRYYFGDLNAIKPACVVGGIPFGTVLELSHGISDREVRYRANGGVFLAHQSGGNESLRIVGKTWGPNRFLFLNMLDFLFLFGSSTMIDIFRMSLGDQSVEEFGQDQTDLGTINSHVIGATADPWVEFKLENLSEGYREKHLTFPIITRERIYLSMYIETFTWKQTIELGRKTVEYTIFFRKYEPDDEIVFRNLVVNKNTGAERTILVYKESQLLGKERLLFSASKAMLEIVPTIIMNLGTSAKPAALMGFGAQFIKNYFTGATYTTYINNKQVSTRIPSIIEQRFF